MLTLVWDWSHLRQKHPATIPAPGAGWGQNPSSLPGCSQAAASGLTSSPSEAGLFFKELQGHGLLLLISSEGQLRPSRKSLSLALAGFPSALENTVPSQQAASLQICCRFGDHPRDATLGKWCPHCLGSFGGLGWVGATQARGRKGNAKPSAQCCSQVQVSPGELH